MGYYLHPEVGTEEPAGVVEAVRHLVCQQRAEGACQKKSIFGKTFDRFDELAIGEAVILSTGTPKPAQWTCRRQCRYRAEARAWGIQRGCRCSFPFPESYNDYNDYV